MGGCSCGQHPVPLLLPTRRPPLCAAKLCARCLAGVAVQESEYIRDEARRQFRANQMNTDMAVVSKLVRRGPSCGPACGAPQLPAVCMAVAVCLLEAGWAC